MFGTKLIHSSRLLLVSWMTPLTLITTNPCPGTVGMFAIASFHSELPLIEWALPDQLVYWIVSAILRVCSAHPDRVGNAVDTILRFITQVAQKLLIASREYSRVFLI